jgi:Rrf2 family protein
VRLEITRRADLAVRALAVLAGTEGRLKGSELARALDTTPGFVPQVLGPLVTAGWVRSDPGPTGGYRLTAPLEDISVLQVIEAVEGPTDLGRCVVADRPCGATGTCALHVAWSRARSELMSSLGGLAMADVEPVAP